MQAGSLSNIARSPSLPRIWEVPALKVIVLRDYFELSGQPVHKTVVHDNFLTIPDEFGADSERNIGGISIGLFFSLRCVNTVSNTNLTLPTKRIV